ncbi:LysR family transcriptional regulator [Xanthobacter pseudotagetidis]|uniref:LysR family transcriptional regulator n=1 Tax=Xanthobacter pseudotagetidis TaxID=3119911 RepID=UPI00372A978D
MLIRQLEYLVAVARERHFGRAARACAVSQPALSTGIRKLEEELGRALVVRSHRYEGLTLDGERALIWAQRMVADFEGLRQELSDPGGGLSGVLRIGAIPGALPSLPTLVNAFCERHPKVRVQVKSMPSAAIQRSLDEMEIEAGVTYLHAEPLARVRARPLYEESYVFVTCTPWFEGRDHLTWSEAARRPLCLLTRDMQHRRIVDQIFAEAGIACEPRIEVNSFEGVWTVIRSGPWGGILPASHVPALSAQERLHVLALVDPVRTQPVGLVTSDRDPASPLADAFLRHAPRVLRAPERELLIA